MARVTRGFKARRRHKRILKLASGYIGTRSKLFRTAIESVERGLCYAYRDRKTKKRIFRKLWIVRLNAAIRAYGMNYSTLIGKMKSANMQFNRRTLSELAILDKTAFSEIVSKIHAV